jgi:hypothetical protein
MSFHQSPVLENSISSFVSLVWSQLCESWCRTRALAYWQLIFPGFLLLQRIRDVVWQVVCPEYFTFCRSDLSQYGLRCFVSPDKSSLYPLTRLTWQLFHLPYVWGQYLLCLFCLHLFQFSTFLWVHFYLSAFNLLSRTIYLFYFLVFSMFLFSFSAVCFLCAPDSIELFFAKSFSSNTNIVLLLYVSLGTFLWRWISLVLLFLSSFWLINFLSCCIFFHLLSSLTVLSCCGDLSFDILK